MGKNYPSKVSIDDTALFAIVYSTNSHKQERKEYKKEKN